VGIGAQMVIKLLSFIFSIMILRRLGAEQYGQYTAALAFGGVFVFISDLGLSVYSVRAIARLRDQADGKTQIEKLFQDVLQLRILLALFTAILIISTAWLTGRPLEMIVGIALGTLGLLMYSVQGSAEAVLAGYERLDISAGGRILHQLTFVLVGSAVLLAGLSYLGLIVANLLGIALITTICWRGVRALDLHSPKMRLSTVDPKLWLKLVRYSVPFGIISFTLGLSYKFDSILLNVFHGDSATGYYNAAYTLVFSSVMLSNSINSALFPSLARQATLDASALPSIYQRALRYLMVLSLPIACGTWLLADQLVPFIFGEEYAPVIPILGIIIWVLPLMYASEFLGYVVLIGGQETKVARSVIISTTINVAANLLLIPRYGLFAAAAMTVATEVVLVLQYVWLLRQELPVAKWSNVLLGPLAATAIMAIITLLLRDHTPLLLTIALAALSYLLLLFAFGVLGRAELSFIRQLQQQTQQRLTVRPVEP
jgi:O-antigen/teichoic acid export membrane protein